MNSHIEKQLVYALKLGLIDWFTYLLTYLLTSKSTKNWGTKMKHTQGPWRSLGPQEVNGPIGVVKDTLVGKIKCTFDVAIVLRASKSTEYGGLEQAEANAHLIAAAPEMLEALERAIKIMELDVRNTDGASISEYDTCLRFMDSVVDKARGAK